MRTQYSLMRNDYCVLPTAYCLLPTAYCLLPTAYCLLPTAYCLLPTAYCLLPTRTRPPPPAVASSSAYESRATGPGTVAPCAQPQRRSAPYSPRCPYRDRRFEPVRPAGYHGKNKVFLSFSKLRK